MSVLRTILFLSAVLLLITGCKQKKKASPSGDEPIEVSDFLSFFPTVGLSYQFEDSLLVKKDKDSLLINQKVFTQFVPDSAIAVVFNKEKKLKMFPLGKAMGNKKETYLFAKIIGASKRAIFIVAFDNDDRFITAMPLIRSDLSRTMQRTASIDKKFTITKNQLRKNADGSFSEGRDVYVLNADTRSFMLIMTDALDDRITELINPIDTLPRKHKLSADYSTNKMNLVSIRDGRKGDRLTFFIHMEKSNGECAAELKGEATIRSATLAEYRQGGDPCVLQFRFSPNAVTLKEIEGCGSHRGLRCTFDASYPRKKEIKPKAEKKKPTVKK